MWLRYEATTLQIPTFHVAFSLDLAGLVKKQLDYLPLSTSMFVCLPLAGKISPHVIPGRLGVV